MKTRNALKIIWIEFPFSEKLGTRNASDLGFWGVCMCMYELWAILGMRPKSKHNIHLLYFM